MSDMMKMFVEQELQNQIKENLQTMDKSSIFACVEMGITMAGSIF